MGLLGETNLLLPFFTSHLASISPSLTLFYQIHPRLFLSAQILGYYRFRDLGCFWTSWPQVILIHCSDIYSRVYLSHHSRAWLSWPLSSHKCHQSLKRYERSGGKGKQNGTIDRGFLYISHPPFLYSWHFSLWYHSFLDETLTLSSGWDFLVTCNKYDRPGNFSCILIGKAWFIWSTET